MRGLSSDLMQIAEEAVLDYLRARRALSTGVLGAMAKNWDEVDALLVKPLETGHTMDRVTYQVAEADIPLAKAQRRYWKPPQWHLRPRHQQHQVPQLQARRRHLRKSYHLPSTRTSWPNTRIRYRWHQTRIPTADAAGLRADHRPHVVGDAAQHAHTHCHAAPRTSQSSLRCSWKSQSTGPGSRQNTMEPEGRAVAPGCLRSHRVGPDPSQDEHGSGSMSMDRMVEMPSANQDTKAGTDQSILVGGQLETLP